MTRYRMPWVLLSVSGSKRRQETALEVLQQRQRRVSRLFVASTVNVVISYTRFHPAFAFQVSFGIFERSIGSFLSRSVSRGIRFRDVYDNLQAVGRSVLSSCSVSATRLSFSLTDS